jgi:transcription initiation factor TFIIH subunit 3
MNLSTSGPQSQQQEGILSVVTTNDADEPPSHLQVILETHPTPYATSISLPTLLSTLLLLINAHLSLSHQNTASFIASAPHVAKFLYPESPADSVVHAPPLLDPQNNSMYRAFGIIKTAVTRNIRHLLAQQYATKSAVSGTQLAGALSLGLTYINRLHVNQPLLPPSARILIISTSADHKGQYIPIMNAIFAAQKTRIPIDVIRIGTEEESSGSTFLQQASYTTNGVYTKLDAGQVRSSLPQYLLQLYAADQATRSQLVFPKR